MRVRVVPLVALLLSPVGCSLLVSTSGYTGGSGAAVAEAGSDAGEGSDGSIATTDAASDGALASEDAATDGPPGTVNVLTEGSFEQSLPDCSPRFTTSNSALSRSTTAHTGAYACKVCGLNSGVFSIDLFPGTVAEVVPGETYASSAWVKGEVGVSAVLLAARVFANGVVVEQTRPVPVQPDDTWRRISVIHTVTKAGGLNVYLPTYENSSANVPCFYVDDWEVHRVP